MRRRRTSDLPEESSAPQGYDESGRVLLTPNNERRVRGPPKKNIFVPDTVPVTVHDGSNNVRVEHFSKKEVRAASSTRVGKVGGAPAPPAVRAPAPTPLYLDSKAALDLANDPAHFKLTKHILRHAYELRDRVARGVYAPSYVETSKQLADVLTKALRPGAHREFLAAALSPATSS